MTEDFSWNYLDWGECLPRPSSSYLMFRKKKTCFDFVRRQLEYIEIYSKYIERYPEEQYEKLAFLYDCHRGVCALDGDLLDDFMVSWKTLGWGLWLVLITPYDKSSYETLITKKIEEYKHVAADDNFNDLIDIALDSFPTTEPTCELSALAYKYRHYLEKMPRQKVPLRKWPSKEENTQAQKYRDSVRRVYRDKGVGAVVKYMRENSPDWLLSYGDWMKRKQS